MVNEARLTLGLLSCFAQKRHREIGGCSPEQKDSDNTNQTSESHNRRCQAACTGLPALPMRMRLVLFGRARHSVRAVFSIAIHDSRENTATAFRLPPTISVRLCLIARIDRGELCLNHFVDKLPKSPAGFPAKYLANLISATDQPCWFCRPIKRRIMLHVFLPWKVNNGESRFGEITH